MGIFVLKPLVVRKLDVLTLTGLRNLKPDQAISLLEYVFLSNYVGKWLSLWTQGSIKCLEHSEIEI